MGSILELTTDLRSLRSQTYTGRKPYVSTTLPADFNAPPPKTPNTLELAAEARQDDASRLVQLLKDRPGLSYLAKQGLLSYSESGKIGKALKDVAATATTLITQATLSGTGFHGSVDIITGNTYLPVNTTANSKVLGTDRSVAAPNPSNTTAKSIDAKDNSLYNNLKTDLKGDVQRKKEGLFEPSGELTYPQFQNTYENDKEAIINQPESSLLSITSFVDVTGKEILSRKQGVVKRIKEVKESSDSKKRQKEFVFKLGEQGSSFFKRGTLDAVDKLNYQEWTTTELTGKTDLINFKIAVYEPGMEPGYLYFRAYLEDFGDNFSGEWNGTNYIGRAESVFNYTGFKRDVSFGFKIAAHTEAELLPLYRKLNKLAGTTAPSYSNTFMRGVFVKLTVGDYLSNQPGFFNSVNLTWDKSYPWESKVDDTTYSNTPQVPHILDVRIAFTPIHDFAPAFNQPFITNSEILSKERQPVPSYVGPGKDPRANWLTAKEVAAQDENYFNSLSSEFEIDNQTRVDDAVNGFLRRTQPDQEDRVQESIIQNEIERYQIQDSLRLETGILRGLTRGTALREIPREEITPEQTRTLLRNTRGPSLQEIIPETSPEVSQGLLQAGKGLSLEQNFKSTEENRKNLLLRQYMLPVNR
jgi:hypothetical protein